MFPYKEDCIGCLWCRSNAVMGNKACALYILNMEMITPWLISCYDMWLLCLIGKQEHLVKGESANEQVSSKGMVLIWGIINITCKHNIH